MTYSDLYKELDVDYSRKDQDMFFAELAAAAENVSAPLGGSKQEKTKYRQSLEKEIREMKQELDSYSAEFSKVLEVYPLSEREFHAHGYQIPTSIANDLKSYKFALVNLPITLVPAHGWGFNSLDCIVTYNPDRPVEQQPIAYQLFPSEIWQEKIRLSQQLTIGVDEFFNFHAVGSIPAIASGGVGTDILGGIRLMFGPYTYSVKIPKVTVRGANSTKARWILEGEENIQQQELKLGMILKVPRQAKKVEVVSVMALRRKFHTFTADVHYLVKFIKERSRLFFERGASPVFPPGVWDITKQLEEG
jgi:hypothetical protein